MSSTHQAPGTGSLEFDLSGIRLRLDGVPTDTAGALCRDWAAFRVDDGAQPFLRVEVRLSQRFAPPLGRFDPKSMRSELGPSHASFRMPEGRIDLDISGRANVELGPDLGALEYFTLLNLLRAALAWRLPSRGAALVHAAALVLDGRGFALVGAEGSGKTTWARTGESGGAQVVSDDLILLDADAGGFSLLGAPFRSTHRVAYRQGRWPLAAILFPRHGATPSLAPVPPLLAQARIVANLPFVAEALDRDERLGAVVRRLAARARCLELTFAPDASYLAHLRGIGLPG